MKKAYRIIWWNKKDGKDSLELDTIIISSSINKIFDLFQQEFQDYDVNLINNVETMPSIVVTE